MKKAAKLLISGRVQGVFFRASTQKQARLLDVSGWVKNLPGGQVEVFVQGEAQAVDQLTAWCHRGPLGARVDEVKIIPATIDKNLTGFSVH